MPTPSAPDPHTPYTFSSTCPDTDESSRQQEEHQIPQQQQQEQHPPPPSSPQHDPPHVITTDATGEALTMPSQAGTSSPPDLSPPSTSQFMNNDMPVPFGEVSSPLPSGPDDHSNDNNNKPTDDDTDWSIDEVGSSPVGPGAPAPQTSLRPRQGVGTARVATDAVLMEVDEGDGGDALLKTAGPEAEYVMEEDYALPGMGTGFASRRVCVLPPAVTRWDQRGITCVLEV